MLSDDLVAALGALRSSLGHRAPELITVEFQRLRGPHVSPGFFQSTAFPQFVDRAASHAFKLLAAELEDSISASIRSTPADASTAAQSQVQTLAVTELSALGASVVEHRDRFIAAQAAPPGGPPLNEVHASVGQSILATVARLQLALLNNTGVSAMTQQNILNVNAPNAAVNASFGSTVQTMHAQSQATTAADALAAIDALIGLVRSAPDLPASRRDETLEVLSDVRTEASKERPNRLKLGGLLSGAKDVVQIAREAAPLIEKLIAWSQGL